MPDMKTALTTALSLKPKPLKFRIWHWLKDHPEKTVDEITKGLGMPYNLGNVIRDMYMRGDLDYKSDKGRVNPVTGLHATVKRWYVTNKNELHNTRKIHETKKRKAAAAGPLTAPVPKPAAKTSDFDPEQLVNTLTLQQCRQLYNYLYDVFGAA